MLRLYQALLHLYPAAYRQEFGKEMQCVFLQAQSERRTAPWLSRATFCARELSGLLSGAAQARLLSLFGIDDCIRLRRFNMRPQFRFPGSTVFLMCVILAGVELAIEKAKTIVQMKEGLPPRTMAAWHPLFWLYPFAVALAVAGAVWGILFALRRTGVHRLDRAQAWPEQKR
jgi:hypothetical protein